MCGIAGWTDLQAVNGGGLSPDNAGNAGSFNHQEGKSILSRMCAAMIHRGPDSEGAVLSGGFALGMRRLAVIDVEGGSQPVWNEDKSISAVMNGEIYNFKEIRDSLAQKGHRFSSRSDTEILPHLYEEYGEGMLDHLDGMFAFALRDIKRQKLFIARDRFGEKPLYYGSFGGRLIFASEPQSLLAHPDVEREINLDALRSYLAFDYVPAPQSIYKNIYKLPAAHALTVEDGEITVRRYWDLSFIKPLRPMDIREAALHLEDLLDQAVKSRMVSDVPLGVLLSGGLDSSTVAAFAVSHSRGKIKTFSIGFEEESFDESKYASQVAAHLGTEHYERRLKASDAVSLIAQIGGSMGEPLADSSLLPTMLLSGFARREVTVALGGDGGDEIFAGYPMYKAHRLTQIYNRIPQTLRSGVIMAYKRR